MDAEGTMIIRLDKTEFNSAIYSLEYVLTNKTINKPDNFVVNSAFLVFSVVLLLLNIAEAFDELGERP